MPSKDAIREKPVATEAKATPAICRLCENDCPDCKEVRPDIPTD